MKDKDLSSSENTVILVAITFLIIFIISASLYYKSTYIDEILSFLLLLPVFALLYVHEYLSELKIYVISILTSLLILIFGIISILILELINHKIIFILSIIPLVFISFHKFLNYFFFKIFNRNAAFVDRDYYTIEDHLYMLFLIGSSAVIPFIIYDSVKNYLI